ncbi:hypothetical protein APICC_00379 [Apis cerana cerana]|uniref:Uncharacterized protein n=1 Tax=Apis cerana cerana TaxID=94128 RepID=A0A2A3EAL1_APICC|nr:hypothetical protein APICC_00379 [Apis cerana cerana]
MVWQSQTSQYTMDIYDGVFMIYVQDMESLIRCYRNSLRIRTREQIANLNENLKEFEGEVTYPTGRKTSQLRYSSSETKKILIGNVLTRTERNVAALFGISGASFTRPMSHCNTRKLKYDVKQDVCCTIDITYSADFDLECCLRRFRLESCKAKGKKMLTEETYTFMMYLNLRVIDVSTWMLRWLKNMKVNIKMMGNF